MMNIDDKFPQSSSVRGGGPVGLPLPHKINDFHVWETNDSVSECLYDFTGAVIILKVSALADLYGTLPN